MTYLELLQRLHAESGAGGAAPSAVSGLTGEYARLASWINQSYLDIQNKNNDWRFMWNEFSFNTVAADGEYTPAEVLVNNPGLGLARYDFESFRYYLTSLGFAGEQWMSYVAYPAFRDFWRFGANRTQQGVPQYFTQAPNRNLLLAQIPNDIYTIVGQFYRTPHQLAQSTDEPIFPSEFHMAIVWWALIKYAGREEAGAVYTNAQNQLTLVLGPMEIQERPPMGLWAPLT